MAAITDQDSVREQASRTASAAAGRADAVLHEIHDLAGLAATAEFFNSAWNAKPDDPILSFTFARALLHAGCYCAGAFADGELVGAGFGFLGLDGGLHLHSHLLAVRSDTTRRGIGFALKQHQRAWALEHGIDSVCWTFDPLVRRNAYFNVSKLGAEVVEYYPHFYGGMSDGVNGGDESDRVLVRWQLNSERAIAASTEQMPDTDVDELLDRGAAVLLDEGGGHTPMRREGSASVALCRVPADIVAIRQADPRLALAWRRALRDTMGQAMYDGYRVTGATRSGWYVLERRRPGSLRGG